MQIIYSDGCSGGHPFRCSRYQAEDDRTGKLPDTPAEDSAGKHLLQPRSSGRGRIQQDLDRYRGVMVVVIACGIVV